MKTYITIKKLELKKNLDSLDVDASDNPHSRKIFEFCHQITKRFPTEGNPNTVINDVLDCKDFDFNNEFDIIMFKTLLNEYITYMNNWVGQMITIFASGVKRFFDSPQSKVNDEINLKMIDGLSRTPQILLDSTLLTKSKLIDFLSLHGKEMDIHLEFDDDFLREKINEGNEWFDKLKQGMQPKKWWQF